MRRLVLKFGGSSVGDVEKIKHAAKIVMEHAQSTEVIVVVSAMQGETNRLLELAKKTYNPLVPNREFDQVLATGEIISASLMALALEAIGLKTHIVEQPDQLIRTVDAALYSAYSSDQRSAVLMSQKLIGRKEW